MKTDGAVLRGLLTETTFVANLAGLLAIGHFVVPNPGFTQGVSGLLGALLLSLVWMRRFEDLDLRRPTEGIDHERR